MTPKEKASNLVEIFWTEVEDNNYETRKMSFAQAKQCALIAVNEIINSNPINPRKYSMFETPFEMVNKASDYWQEVKHEIEKL